MKTATINIHKQAVLAAIDALTFKRVDGVLSAESEQIKNALSSDSEERLDLHLLHEHMETRDARIRKRLAFCLEREDDDLTVSNLQDIEKPTYDYRLLVPEFVDRQRLKVVAKSIHDYMVQGVLHDWYAVQNMTGSRNASELEEMEDAIAAMLRPSFVQRPLQPFGPQH